MSFWVLVQIVMDLFLLTGIVFLWVRLHRPAKDDPRMSRGLQLLQSKISVIEDLSDRTETQVQQVSALMEQKVREIQAQLLAADKQIQSIESSRSRSLEVAKIFQDKIPHQEIIERQNTIKYVKAARLAHQGLSVQEIAKEVDLSPGEIEFIAKVNRDQLQFSEGDLPDWARHDSSDSTTPSLVPSSGMESPLSQLGEQFRRALPSHQQEFVGSATRPPVPTVAVPAARPSVRTTVETRDQIRKFEFPKIDVSKNLG